MSTKKVRAHNIFSARILALRRKLGFTQTELADELKINRSYLSQIENGLEPSSRLKERVEILEKIGVVSRSEGGPEGGGALLGPRLIAWRKRLSLESAEAARVLRIARGRYEEYEAGREPNRFFTEKFNALESQSRTVIDQLLGDADLGRVQRAAEELSPDERQAMEDLGADALQLHWIPLISWAHAGRSLEGDFSERRELGAARPDPRKGSARHRGADTRRLHGTEDLRGRHRHPHVQRAGADRGYCRGAAEEWRSHLQALPSARAHREEVRAYEL